MSEAAMVMSPSLISWKLIEEIEIIGQDFPDESHHYSQEAFIIPEESITKSSVTNGNP